MSLQGNLNRLLNTRGVSSQRAANELAGTSGKELLGALNVLAGTTGKGMVYVWQKIAEEQGGLLGLDPVGSAASIPDGAISIGGFQSYIVGFSSAFTGEYMAFQSYSESSY